MLDNKFRSFEDKIQRQMDNKLLGFQTQLHKMEARLQEIEKKAKKKTINPRKKRWMKITILGTRLKS
jgi:Skp family chaperone for outer membrane proteins